MMTYNKIDSEVLTFHRGETVGHHNGSIEESKKNPAFEKGQVGKVSDFDQSTAVWSRRGNKKYGIDVLRPETLVEGYRA